MTICVLGRQPELGLAELESLYGSEHVRPVGETCALVDAEVDFSRLGGSVKAAELLVSLPDISRKTVFKKIASTLPDLLKILPADGKIKLGLSVYGFDISPYELGGEALRLKKIIRSSGRSVRVVPNETPALSSAQTFHNSLASTLGLEFVLIRDGDQTLIGRVTSVQNINTYRIRDRERPKRDAFVGMLPPKLAQIIVNLAVGEIGRSEETAILDPFCGTGVILQEALLMGYDVYGSDISQKMVDYTAANLRWLSEERKMKVEGRIKLEAADATSRTWDSSSFILHPSSFSIATEAYLGQPLGGQQPTAEKLQSIIHSCNTVMRGFLKNIASQLPKDARLCIAMPAWFVNDTLHHLPVLGELERLGFQRVSFDTAPGDLIYRRDDQVTGRELVVLTKVVLSLKNRWKYTTKAKPISTKSFAVAREEIATATIRNSYTEGIAST